MKKSVLFVGIVLCASIMIAGCGETINGMNKDVSRIGKGVKTVFIRDN